MNLSEHFTFEELTRTDLRQFQDRNREDAQRFLGPLTRVCFELLEPCRKLLGCSLTINSGYRMPELNDAIGGSRLSQHMAGEAADFISYEWSAEDLRVAVNLIAGSNVRFNQLLVEHGCIHIALPNKNTIQGEVAFWEAGKKTVIRERVLG